MVLTLGLSACGLAADEPPPAESQPPAASATTPSSPAAPWWVDELDSVENCTEARLAQLAVECQSIERWAGRRLWESPLGSPAEALRLVEDLAAAADRATTAVDAQLALSSRFATTGGAQDDRALLRYGRSLRLIIELEGRLRYLVRDGVEEASAVLVGSEAGLALFPELTHVLVRHRGEAGALTLVDYLHALAPRSEVRPLPAAHNAAILRCLAELRHPDAIATLAPLLRLPSLDPGLRLSLIDVIRHLGVPQATQPRAAPGLLAPPVTALELLEATRRVTLRDDAPPQLVALRQRLDQELAGRVARGLDGGLAWGAVEFQPGDLLLLRESRPALSLAGCGPDGALGWPTLGIVTDWTTVTEVRHLVLVEVDPRGDSLVASNVESRCEQASEWLALRPRDESLRARLASQARERIGRAALFDPLSEDRSWRLPNGALHGDGWGLLRECGGRALAQRPLVTPELSAMRQGLSRLGVDASRHLGPVSLQLLCAGNMELVGRGRPLYDPESELRERVRTEWLRRLAWAQGPPPTELRRLLTARRDRLARLSPGLARALSRVDASARPLLENDARAVALFTLLDDFGEDACREFRGARRVVLTPEDEPIEWEEEEEPPEELARRAEDYADLRRRFSARGIHVTEVRIAIVERVLERLGRRLDGLTRAASAPAAPTPTPSDR